MTPEQQLDIARRNLHQLIDLRASDLFFMVEFWHVYRTTGELMANLSPEGYILYNGDLIQYDMPIEESSVVHRGKDRIDAIINNQGWEHEVQAAKWQESITGMNNQHGHLDWIDQMDKTTIFGKLKSNEIQA